MDLISIGTLLKYPVKPAGILPIIHHPIDEVDHNAAGFFAHLGLQNSKTPRVGDPNHFVDVEHHQDGAVGPHLKQRQCDDGRGDFKLGRRKDRVTSSGSIPGCLPTCTDGILL